VLFRYFYDTEVLQEFENLDNRCSIAKNNV